MAYRRRQTTRKRRASGYARPARGRIRRSSIRRRSASRSASGRPQTVRIVVQGASAPAASPVILSEAGRMLTPTGDKRSRF